MPARVTLHIDGQQPLVYHGRGRCLVGRGLHCNLRMPNDTRHDTVSRNHCLLDINPPEVMLRDFGSLNGTYHNERLIGRRLPHQSALEGGSLELPLVRVADGDTIRFGETTLSVAIYSPVFCTDCSVEIPEKQRDALRVEPPAKTGPDAAGPDKALPLAAGSSPTGDTPSSTITAKAGNEVFRCGACRERLAAKAAAMTNDVSAIQLPKPAKPSTLCVNCRADVSDKIPPGRRGEVLCQRCRNDIGHLVNRLLDRPPGTEDDATRLIGRGWEVRRELGRGGMGAVYHIVEAATGRDLAIKVLLPQVATDPNAKDMFCREIDNTRALEHPNIVRLRGAGCVNSIFFFTMDYCDGGSLDALVRRAGGRLPISEALDLTAQLLVGLDFAHNAEIPYVEFIDGGFGQGRGLVHRDLKPSNLLIHGQGPQRVLRIADFGIAKAFDTAGLSGFTPTGALWGTPEYMPRQLILDFKYARPEVDVWSAAATLYRLLTGRPPRDFPKGKPALKVLLESAPVPIRQRQADIPPRLAQVIDAALREEPQLKFKSANELSAALREAMA